MRNKNEIFYFERGAFFAGSLMYKIEAFEGKYILKGIPYNDFCWMDDIEFEIPEKEILCLEKLLKPVLKWKKQYETKDEIFDGYGWDIYFQYKDRFIKTQGYEKYPINYRKVIKKLQLFLEQLGEKYNENYQSEGKSERIELW